MRTTRMICMAIVAIILCGLVAACSSDDDGENENGAVAGKRLAKVEIRDSWGTLTSSFTYDASGELSAIHVDNDEDTEDIIFTIGTTNIAWVYKDNRYGETYRFKATMEHGRVQKGRIKIDEDIVFTYDGNRRLQEINTEIDFDGTIYTETYILTWDGGNIKKIDCYYDGELLESIEYTYSNYKAGMLAYELGINPFTDFNFLDCVWERAVFYTGYCGQLSNNLPASATFYKNGTKIGERTYKYATSGDNVVSVTMDGYYNGGTSYGYPWKMYLTWE